jgi:hypothetical protein
LTINEIRRLFNRITQPIKHAVGHNSSLVNMATKQPRRRSPQPAQKNPSQFVVVILIHSTRQGTKVITHSVYEQAISIKGTQIDAWYSGQGDGKVVI